MRENLPKGSRKLLNAWALYDFANSVYSLSISSAIFPIFYGILFQLRKSKYIDFFGFELKSTVIITYVTAVAFFIVATISPLLSGIADYVGNKKSFMKFFCYTGAISCVGLSFFSLDHIHIGVMFYFFGVIGFWGSLVFYNSYLPDIAYPDQYDSISAKGYALGYIGGVILLIIDLAMVMYPSYFGISGSETEASIMAMRISFITVGVWWALFSQYSFYYLPKHIGKKNKIKKNIIFNGYKELRSVWRQLKNNRLLRRYLIAFFVFSMGVQTIMLVAAYFGEQEVKWESDSQRTIGLIVSIMLIQFIAAMGAKLAAFVSAKLGNIRTLIIINCIWVCVCVLSYFIEYPHHFYIAAVMVGLVMGGIQSLSRSTYSKYLPETQDTTSFFSFYDVAEKVGIVIGMVVYGTIDLITGSMRNSALFLMIFFMLGIILLMRVREARPRVRKRIR